jgi:hypothetical protein
VNGASEAVILNVLCASHGTRLFNLMNKWPSGMKVILLRNILPFRYARTEGTLIPLSHTLC